MIIKKLVKKLHPKQQEISSSEKRFRVVVCGRRFGKTTLALNELGKFAMAHKGSNCWWISTTHLQAKEIFGDFKRLYRKLIKQSWNYEKKIELVSGSEIKFKGSQNYKALVSEGVDFLVIDEAGVMDEIAWFESLRPTLSDTLGKCLMIGTPKGKNWFYFEYLKGISGSEEEDEEYASWRIPSYENPFVPEKEIESMRKGMPEQLFKQEVLAEFFGNNIGVFGDVSAVFEDKYDKMQNSIPVMIDFERFNEVSWSFQKGIIKKKANKYKHSVFVVDASNIGDPIVEDLMREGIKVIPFVITRSTKVSLIRNLQLAIENREVIIKKNKQLVDELESYEYNITKNGQYTFSAPRGKHDDCVIALALALHGLKETNAPIVFGVDLAKKHDYTAIVGIKTNKKVEYFFAGAGMRDSVVELELAERGF